MTREERHLWYDYLRCYPVKFLRQHPVGNYILDFYCAGARLAVELDGSQHFEEAGKEYDERRSAFLSERGIALIRFPNNEIWNNFSGVCEAVDLAVKKRRTDA